MSEIVLQAKGLKKSFKSPTGLLTVLRSIDLEVYAGESVSIRGSSGSGKTTLLQLLGGLDVPDSGEVKLKLSSRTMLSPHRCLGQGVGFVFQNYQLMPELNAWENVALAAQIAGQGESEKEAQALLALVGLSHRIHHMPTQLSGGECQRVAIARALINQPAVILADEPTGNLDEVTGKDVMNLLLEVVAQRNTALVLVTHSKEFAERTQRRFFLSSGVLTPA